MKTGFLVNCLADEDDAENLAKEEWHGYHLQLNNLNI